MNKEFDKQENIIEGRTQALEFIGNLSVKWREIAKEYYRKDERFFGLTSYPKIAEAYEECADMLEQKIEEFANI